MTVSIVAGKADVRQCGGFEKERGEKPDGTKRPWKARSGPCNDARTKDPKGVSDLKRNIVIEFLSRIAPGVARAAIGFVARPIGA